MKIGLALSGGGMRAAVFHSGLLARLADENLLEEVTAISSVSGGSMGIGLVYTANNNRWPTSEEYRTRVVPYIRAKATGTNIQQSYIRRLLRSPMNLFRARAIDISHLMQELWGITARLKAIPHEPYWMINATCYETGVNWRFAPDSMGDYLFGYSPDPDIPLADALAASGAFPGLIGPLVLDARRFKWFSRGETVSRPHLYQKVRLWDGGVYENLGTEPLFKPGKGYQHDIDFLITSDAGEAPEGEVYNIIKSGYRLIGLATGQVRALRARMVVAHLQEGNPGSYFQIDNSAAYLLGRAHLKDELAEVEGRYLSDSEVKIAASMGPTLRQLTHEEFERLFRHGFEVADVTMHAFKSGGRRPLRGYKAEEWR